MLYIITSKNEGYQEAANLIVDECYRASFMAQIVDITDFDCAQPNGGDCIFFLTNEPLVGLLASDLLAKGITVINGKFVTGERVKSYVQKRVQTAGVKTPEILDVIEPGNIKKKVEGLSFPMYIKSQNHARGIFRAATRQEFDRILLELDRSLRWYAEEAVDTPTRQLQKIYWVAGSCFERDRQSTLRVDIKTAMNTMGGEFLFVAFSADFILDSESYWCIDVNPAPGLFGSEAARAAFVNLVRSRFAHGRGSFADIYRKAIERRGGLKPFILHKIRRSAGELIRRLQRALPSGGRILEVGAGTGAISALLAELGFDATAIDSDAAMLPTIQESFNALGVKADVRSDNAFNLTGIFAPGTFDCAISHGVMEHYDDTDIARLLKAQLAVAKRVTFVVPTAAMTDEYRRRGFGDERYLTTHDWCSILQRNGFIVKAVYGFGSKETKHQRLPEALWRWDTSARLFASLAAFNEFWIEAR